MSKKTKTKKKKLSKKEERSKEINDGLWIIDEMTTDGLKDIRFKKAKLADTLDVELDAARADHEEDITTCEECGEKVSNAIGNFKDGMDLLDEHADTLRLIEDTVCDLVSPELSEGEIDWEDE